MNPDPTIIIIAGPNGAGKTTFAREFLPQEASCLTFINADLIAQGLSPFLPEEAAVRAARLMLEMIAEYVEHGESFAIETTLSGRTYARMIPQWKQAGYQVALFFLQLPNEDLAVSRVADRVAQGGHDIPEAVIRRRFHAGISNFHALYKPLVDDWRLYDNSGERPTLISRSNPS
jgi:predicted ABC-type ATPase